MIDIATEEVFPLSDVPDRLGHARRGGRRMAVSTPFRWRKDGLRGVRLEAIRCGGTLCTSMAALQRFFDALGRADGPAPRPPSSRRRAVEAAGRELDRL